MLTESLPWQVYSIHLCGLFFHLFFETLQLSLLKKKKRNNACDLAEFPLE